MRNRIHTPAGRTLLVLAVALTVVLALVLVSSAVSREGKDTPKMSPDPYVEESRSVLAMTQCLIDSGKIPENELAGETWLTDGKINPTAEFSQWFTEHATAVYAGKELETWEDEAIAAGSSWRCPFPKVSPT